ncbi:uncharacterized protein LOC133302948 [Gastrolobium bilobum]|uniref:uncharacterized protein LOC133302948 n=1 Tax=Gastrolobium bilobum TaxID=150636 RepID=UPI002AB25637|nr:uncharacterized protein LOC133302948 [Gastrolobium bilobum]
MCDSAACFPCGHPLEDIIHVLRDCVWAKKGRILDSGSTLLVGAYGRTVTASSSMTQPLILSAPFFQIKSIVDSIFLADRLLVTASIIPRSRTECLISWKFPLSGWIKVNTDSSCSPDGERSSCGGVLRDSSGNWLVGFRKFTGHGNALLAELKGILLGLEVA